eukprot:COSAG02_NODE_379_length_23528_cov_140.781510_17_plen_196_part_00
MPSVPKPKPQFSKPNDCVACGVFTRTCYCHGSGAAVEYSGVPPHHGCVVGTVLEYGNPGSWNSGIFLGAIRRGAKCPVKQKVHVRDKSTAQYVQERKWYVAPEPGVMLRVGERNAPKVFVPVSDLRFLTDRTRRAPDRYEPDGRTVGSCSLPVALRRAVFDKYADTSSGRCQCFPLFLPVFRKNRPDPKLLPSAE